MIDLSWKCAGCKYAQFGKNATKCKHPNNVSGMFYVGPGENICGLLEAEEGGMKVGDIIELDSFEDMIDAEANLNGQGIACKRYFDCYSEEPGFCLEIIGRLKGNDETDDENH